MDKKLSECADKELRDELKVRKSLREADKEFNKYFKIK